VVVIRTESKRDIKEWFPEIPKLEGSLKRKTKSVFEELAPEYFWYVPASSSGKHHSEDHRGIYGLVLHSKRAFTAFDRLSRSFEEQGLIDGY